LRICNGSEERKKLLPASGLTLADLRIKGCLKLDIADVENVRIVTSDGFEIDDDDLISEVAKECRTVYFLLSGELLPSCGACPVEPSTTPKQQSEIRNVEIATTPSRGTQALSPNPAVAATAATTLPWPEVYSLPRMDDLANALRDLRMHPEKGSDLKMNATFVNKFLKFIVDHICLNYLSPNEPYLSSSQITDVCTSIVTSYPGLKDTSLSGSSSFWRQKLIRRFKELRFVGDFVDKSSPTVQEMRRKHGRLGHRHIILPNAAAAAAGPSAVTVSQRHKRQYKEVEGQEDDDDNEIIASRAKRANKQRINDDEDLIEEEGDDDSDADDAGSAMAKSVDFGEFDTDVPPSHEARRTRLNETHHDSSISDVLNEMQALFPIRILRCQDLTVSDEIALYAPLVNIAVLQQEAYLMIQTYNRSKTDYVLPPSPSEMRSRIINALLLVYSKRQLLKNFKLCKDYVELPVVSEEDKLPVAVFLLLGRLRVDPSIILRDALPVRILTEDGKWCGVFVNGASIPFDSVTDSIIAFVIVFIAFNLQHLPALEAFLEVIEVLSGLRKKAVRKAAVAILDALR
ncbi:hypothetical protein BOX15_Mlig000438g17, partial [Macrostomum lignano]